MTSFTASQPDSTMPGESQEKKSGPQFPRASWPRDIPTWVTLSISGVLVLLACQAILGTRTSIDASFHAFSSDTQDPDSLLNHANTMFWWGRYRKNTLPEFDTAAAWAQRAMSLAESRAAVDHDTAALNRRRRQAGQIVAQAAKQRVLCPDNIASHIPYFMEMMGHDEALMQEDASPEDMPLIALRGAIGRFDELSSPDRVLPIPQRSSFTLVNVHASHPLAEELLVQEINNRTRLYTISRHELCSILSIDSLLLPALIADPTAMDRVAASYRSDELAVIDFTENDRVDGIYYYSLRFRLWKTGIGWDPRSTYTEYMVRDRGFNHLTPFILSLLMAFLLLAIALSMLSQTVATRLMGVPPASLLHMPVCFIVSVVIQHALVRYVLKIFINPAPEEYISGDGGEQWMLAYPVTFILTLPVCYLILGKLDNYIRAFRSDFENPIALFALSMGSLLAIPFTFTYHQLLRFGFDLSNSVIPGVIGCLALVAALLARHGSRIVNFPEKMHPAARIGTWIAFLVYLVLPFTLVSVLLTGMDSGKIIQWAAGTLLPAILVLESLNIITRLPKRRRTKRQSTIPVDTILPAGIEAYQLDGHARLLYQPDTANPNGRAPEPMRCLYVSASRGMPVRSFLDGHFRINDPIPSYVVDFSAPPPEGTTVHYPAFARAFAEELAYTRFNDVAETARQTSNLLGKALSAITSIGGLLIDDRDVTPRDPRELATTLLRLLMRRPSVLLLDHVERIGDEDILLLEALIDQLPLADPAIKGIPGCTPPALVIIGYGEYGYHDKVLSLLGRLDSDRVKGFKEFKVEYRDPVVPILRMARLPIQVRLHLERLFQDARRNTGPMAIRKTLELLSTQNVLVKDPDWDFQLMAIDRCDRLPDIRIGEQLPMELEESPRLREMLIAAAYLSDSQGRFQVPVLAHALGEGRLEVIRLLKAAERLNIVYDLKGPHEFYWYSFTDPGLVSDFKELENPRQELVSQLANEYHRGFVEYHVDTLQPDLLFIRIEQSFQEGRLCLETLLQLTDRSYAVRPAFPRAAFHIHHAVAVLLSDHSVARFRESLELTRRALAMHAELPTRDREETAGTLFELKSLLFRLMIETGRSGDVLMDSLLVDIRQDPQRSMQGKDEQNEFDLLVVRFRFTRWKPGDQEHGLQCCQSLLASELKTTQRLRAQFYELKLYPQKELMQAGGVIRQWRTLLMDVEALQDESAARTGLFRELLNDYAGSILSDKLLSQWTQPDGFDGFSAIVEFLESIGIFDAPSLLAHIEGLLRKRIEIETRLLSNSSGTDAFSAETLQALLVDELSGIDKRGLCFTLNYLARAYRYSSRFEDAVRIGQFAYRFNMQVDDRIGACVAAGSLGLCMDRLGGYREAFDWFELSFGHGWSLDNRGISEIAIQLYRIALLVSDNGQLIQRARMYLEQAALKVATPHFPVMEQNLSQSLRLLMSIEGLHNRARQENWKPLDGAWGNRADEFLNVIDAWLRRHRPQAGDAGHSYLAFEGRIPMKVDYRVEQTPVMFPELIGIKLILTPSLGGLPVSLGFCSIRGTLEWHLSAMHA
jgi:hypothetical protein